jgi:hypothetical protein
MSKYKDPVTVFSEKKNGPINLLCIKQAHMFTLGLPLSNSHVICEFWLPKILQFHLFTTLLTWNVALSKKYTYRRRLGDVNSF